MVLVEITIRLGEWHLVLDLPHATLRSPILERRDVDPAFLDIFGSKILAFRRVGLDCSVIDNRTCTGRLHPFQR
jgi:hypothetical protein